MSASETLGEVRPCLLRALERRRMPDGRLVLVSGQPDGFMDIRPREEPLLDLLDGRNDLDALVAAGVQLEQPVRPVQVLDLLQRLASRGMLETVLGPASRVFKAPSRPSLKDRLASWIDLRVLVGPLRSLAAPGALFPARMVPLFALGGIVAAISTLIYAMAVDRADHLLNPFFRLQRPLVELPLIYGMLCVALSFRSLARGWTLRGQGLRVPRAGLRFAWGLLFVEIDDREKRAATRPQRELLAAAGLGALGWIAAIALLGWVTGAHRLFRYMAPVALLAFLVDLAPYLRTDGHEVIAIRARVRSYRHRALSYLLRRAARNIAQGVPLTDNERRYLVLGVASTLHVALAVRVLAVHVLPGTLTTINQLLSRGGEGSTLGLFASLALALLLLVGLVLLAGGLVALVGSFVLQLTRGRGRALPPAPRQAAASDRERFVEAASRVPFLSRVPSEALRAIAGHLGTHTARGGQSIIRQGDAGDRLYFIADGRCAIEVEDDTGRRHRLRVLEPGDFFGEVALVLDVKRTAHVVAVEPASLLTLDRAAFNKIVETSGADAAEVVKELRAAALIRAVPALAYLSANETRRVLEAAVEEDYPPGTAIIEQGAHADALYVVRDGQVEVQRLSPGDRTRTVAVLGPGECFGELAFFVEGGRTASVVASGPTTVLKVPSAVFHHVLLRNFATAVVLDELGAARLAALREGER